MTNFTFRLQRVLDWRETELSLEEAKTRAMADALAALRAHKASLQAQALEVARAPEASRSLSGAELVLAEACRCRLLKEAEAVETKIVESEKLLAAQRERLVGARRKVRLLENLKERRRAEWQSELEKELAGQALESALSRRIRERNASRI